MTLFSKTAIAASVLLSFGTFVAILPKDSCYRSEAVALCKLKIPDQSRCTTDIDSLHSRTGESYKNLRNLEKELNNLPASAQSSRQVFRELAIVLSR
jgi:hypothetical protein